jgi:hypothetical protein
MRTPVVLFSLVALAAAQQMPPIIDVHMHASSADGFGALGIKACPGDVAKTWPAADPRSSRTTPDDLEDCPNPIYALRTDAEVFEATKRLMRKYKYHRRGERPRG